MPTPEELALEAKKAADKAAIAEAVGPLVEEVKALGTKLATTEATLADEKKKREILEKTVNRVDANGQPFHIGKAGSRGDSKPLMVSNIWRAVMAGGMGNKQTMEEYAPEEFQISQRLQRAGYNTVHLGSILFPLGEELLLDPVDGKGQPVGDIKELKKEIGERLHVQVDPGQIGWLMKRFPDMAASMGMQRKDLQMGDDTLGGMLVPSSQSDRIIDLLRNRLSVMRVGAQEIPLPPSGNIAYPRLNADPSFTWTDPDTTTDLSTTNIGTGVVRLQAKSLRGAVTIPNDLLRYSSPAVEMVVRSALAAKGAVAEDQAYLEAVGSSLQPKGIISYGLSTAETPAVGKVTLHVAGTVGGGTTLDTLTPEDIAKIEALYYLGNDPDAPTGWIMRPLMFAAIRNRRAGAATAGDGGGPFMFDSIRRLQDAGGTFNPAIEGFPVAVTAQASANRNKAGGSVVTGCYILFGNFNRLIIGRVGTIELAVSEHVKFLQDKTIIRAVLRADSGLAHEESFVVTDSLNES